MDQPTQAGASHTDAVADLRRAVDSLRAESKRRNRLQMGFTLVLLALFVAFGLAIAVPAMTFDQKMFSSRVEANINEAGPAVIAKAGEASKIVVTSLINQINEDMPAFNEKLSARMAEETEAFRTAVANMHSADSSPASQQYVDHAFRALLVESVPALSKDGKLDKLLTAARAQAVARTKDSISDDIKPHLGLLDEIQGDLLKLRSAAKKGDPEAAVHEVLMATLEVMKVRLASGEKLDVDTLLAPMTGGAK